MRESRLFTPFASAFVLLCLSSCGGQNLDARCASVLADVSEEFLDIAEEESTERRIERLANLPQAKRIFSLEADATDAIRSGKVRAIGEKMTFDKLNARKLAALTAANQARFEFRTDTTLRAIELDEEDDGKSAYRAVTTLFTMCNRTLR
ncbi:MAG: hypothetical protein AAGA09_05025 [Pseudomonadota bacterium]